MIKQLPSEGSDKHFKAIALDHRQEIHTSGKVLCFSQAPRSSSRPTMMTPRFGPSWPLCSPQRWGARVKGQSSLFPTTQTLWIGCFVLSMEASAPEEEEAARCPIVLEAQPFQKPRATLGPQADRSPVCASDTGRKTHQFLNTCFLPPRKSWGEQNNLTRY